MRKGSNIVVYTLLCFFFFSTYAIQDEDKHEYVVYMGALPVVENYLPTTQHLNVLQEVTGESSVENRLLTNYKKSFNGFVAKLTQSEVERMSSTEGVVSVFPNKLLQLQTTASWDFMGLKDTAKRVPSVESDTIIGVIDSGIWPESESFNDEGFGPAPKKWKGECNGGSNFTCNNKLIGARFYGEDSARDHKGHGSHTASTAAGNKVENTSFFGLGLGTARGGVPSARIAAYKVCTVNGCASAALLSAFDDAIADGVDIITISIGSSSAAPFQSDPIAIGAFHAMEKGILTVNSAGNSGPNSGTISSVAPWLFSIAASNTNQQFVTKVVLGNKETLLGRSINRFDMKEEQYPLLYGKTASSTCSEESARYCDIGCLEEKLVKGQIVLCDVEEGAKEATRKGAAGVIIPIDRPDVGSTFGIPASALSREDYETIVSYVTANDGATASILKSERVLNNTAPVVVSFSSRGPNLVSSDILKPDVTAPGVEILAAYSLDSSSSKYSVVSGTSMSCPHVAGVAAYVKTFHPDWSDSMIKSAIMTTTWPMNSSVNADAEFAYGSGHVNPIAAVNPGLVYETTKADYLAFLCSTSGSIDKSIGLMAGTTIDCTGAEKELLPRNLNYPSMSAKVDAGKAFNLEFPRSVTNVGTPASTYKVSVKTERSSKLNVKVEPEILTFKSMKEKKSFTVSVSGDGIEAYDLASTSIVWSDGVHTVTSPIVIYASK